ncbi:MAG: sulfopyruvate decarboxylase subunit alpha [Candidatus Methylomirabilia bacterium]
MPRPEQELLGLLEENGVDFTASLPCEKIKVLLELLGRSIFQVPLTREEEGVGICAGAALAGRRPAMFVQSSGVGNMFNALLSLTAFYELPLALFVSRRGIYQERIAAQLPLGLRLPGLLDGAGIAWTEVNSREDLVSVARELPLVYARGVIRAFLLSPAVWEGSECRGEGAPAVGARRSCRAESSARPGGRRLLPVHTRFEILKQIARQLEGKLVVCNLGIPSKELYALGHQPSHFYMLGSMGMAAPIGLGVALSSRREVVVVDGDGSLLMNPGTLAVCAAAAPKNLTILAIDNGVFGSTGSQPTHAATCVDLEQVARGFGIGNTLKTVGGSDLIAALGAADAGPRFIHVLAVPGNEQVPNIPLDHLENKRQVAATLQAGC